MNKQIIFNGCCPYCGSENIDLVDNDVDSTKYICRDCDEDFIVDDNNQKVTDRHNRQILIKEEDEQ